MVTEILCRYNPSEVGSRVVFAVAVIKPLSAGGGYSLVIPKRAATCPRLRRFVSFYATMRQAAVQGSDSCIRHLNSYLRTKP